VPAPPITQANRGYPTASSSAAPACISLTTLSADPSDRDILGRRCMTNALLIRSRLWGAQSPSSSKSNSQQATEQRKRRTGYDLRPS
jgi:hypothetical protein